MKQVRVCVCVDVKRHSVGVKDEQVYFKVRRNLRRPRESRFRPRRQKVKVNQKTRKNIKIGCLRCHLSK